MHAHNKINSFFIDPILFEIQQQNQRMDISINSVFEAMVAKKNYKCYAQVNNGID